MSNNWSYYEDYQYPPPPRREGPPNPRVSGDTIVRAVKRPVDIPPREIPPYCVDRCRIPDISAKPMFRPFRLGDGWDDNFYRLQDLDRSRTEYEVEIFKQNMDPTSQLYRSDARTEASFFKKNDHTYYRLKHGDEYGVRMINNTDNHVNAVLKIDSNVMGKWRIKPHKSIVIERPVHNYRRFTFVSESSSEALEGGVRQLDNEMNGLVEVTFVPLIDKRPDSDIPYTNKVSYTKSSSKHNSNSKPTRSFDSTTNSYESGATFLGNDSKQKFRRDMSRYFVEDRDSKITKRVRIVIDKRTRFTSIRNRDKEYDMSDLVPPRID